MYAHRTRLESSSVPSHTEFKRLFATIANLEATSSEQRAAQNRLLSGNVRLLLSIARPFFGRGLERDEIIQAGLHGLYEAMRRFDPAHGTRFSTYATPWIREKIRKAVFAKIQGSPFHLPEEVTDHLAIVQWALSVFQAINGRWPDEQELLRLVHSHGTVRAAEMKKSNLRVCLRLITEQIEELDVILVRKSDGQEILVSELIGDERYSPETAVMAGELLRLTRAALDEVETVIRSFPQREGIILRHRTGIHGMPVLSHAELGRRYGITRQAIQKLFVKSMRILRRRLCMPPEGLTQLIRAAEELERIVFAFSPKGNGSRTPRPSGPSAIQILVQAGYLDQTAPKGRRRASNRPA